MGYAVQNIAALPFGQIIGAPMMAAIQAQGIAAKQTVEFIQTVGFKPPDADADPLFPDDGGNADIGDVRNVTFTYTVKDREGTEESAELTVPILTIVPIPFIRIDEMTIDFTAKMMEMYTEARKKDAATSYRHDVNVKASARWWWASVSVGYKASFSGRHSSSVANNSRLQTELTMNVNVKAVQDDMPAGLSKMLTILDGAIKESRTAVTPPA